MTMTPERWGRIKALFSEAMELPAAERAAFVARVCGSDIELGEELRSLLAIAGADSIPRIPPAAVARALTDAGGDALDSDAGTRSVLERAVGKEYEIMHRIGRGGMGAVYLARDIRLDMFVAIKVLRPDLAAFAPAARARFKREAQICASLTHPGIIRLFQYGEACGIWYFVMGYVRGTTLADRLRREDPVRSEEVRRILLELADALEYAHGHHVIHRDIKSANILLEDGDVMRPMLADFGISKVQGARDTLTPSLSVIGTPAYMSPEQLVGDPDIDARSDIFSLGLVGYAMLVGREPFIGIDDIVAWRMRHDPEPLSEVAPSAPSGLAAVIMRCLARDRVSRYPDAHALKEALARADRPWVHMTPEKIRPVAGYGQYALAWAIVFAALALVPNHSPVNVALLLLLAALVPLGFVLHIWNIGRGDLSYAELVQVAGWPPEWWGMWWPRRLRRPEDLWMRLPWPARFVRETLSLFFVLLPALILVENRNWLDPGLLDMMKYSLFIGTAVVAAGALWWARRNDLPYADAVRVLFGATMPSPAWGVPHVVRLIAPVRGVRPPNYSKPADWVRTIDDLVPLIPADEATLGAEVTIRAHRLLRAIAECDRDIARLGQDSSDAEIARLERKLDEMMDEASLRGGDKRRDLLELLRGELALVRAMRADRELAAEQRAGLFHLLRALCAQLGRLYERSLGGAFDGPDPTEALRGLCAEVDEALDAPGSPPSSRLATAS